MAVATARQVARNTTVSRTRDSLNRTSCSCCNAGRNVRETSAATALFALPSPLISSSPSSSNSEMPDLNSLSVRLCVCVC
jgi:hypothetical protein